MENTNKTLQDVIIYATAYNFGIDENYLKTNKKQERNATFQKHVCFFLIKKMTLLSNGEIGALFGLKEAAVRCAINKIESFTEIKDKRTLTNIRQIEFIIDSFNEKKVSNLKFINNGIYAGSI